MPKKPFNDCMIDLETTGRSAGCGILSIGAVMFNSSGTGDTFYSVIYLPSCDRAGLVPNLETMGWWNSQSAEARKVLEEAKKKKSSVPLHDALCAFSSWLPPASRVHGNGADFDLPILGYAYEAEGLPLPWKPFNGRCFRTLKNLYKDVKQPKRVGTHHNALDDAIFQAKYAIAIVKAKGLELA